MSDITEYEKRFEEGGLTQEKILELCNNYVEEFLTHYDAAISKSLMALKEEDRSGLNDARQMFQPTRKRFEWLQLQSSKIFDDIPENELESGHVYIIVVDYLREMALQADSILKSSFKHVDNNHKPLIADQIIELQEVHEMVKSIFENIITSFKTLDIENLTEFNDQLRSYANHIREIRKKQINRIKKGKVGSRNTILYLQLLGEFRNMTLFGHRILRVLEDLVIGHDNIEPEDSESGNGMIPQSSLENEKKSPEN